MVRSTMEGISYRKEKAVEGERKELEGRQRDASENRKCFKHSGEETL
jgi:hypothetical protein